MTIRNVIIILALGIFTNKAYGLNKTTSEQFDSTPVSKNTPYIAGGLSIVIPGVGQIYNKQYWKAPLMWTGMIGGAYMYQTQHKHYKSYSSAYALKLGYLKDTLAVSDPYPQYSLSYLKTWRDRHHLIQTIGLVTIGTTYMVNIVEAFASAQSYHNPRAATLMSTILPGSGQIYNKKYWKVPLIYGGFGTMIYFSQVNNKFFLQYRDMYEQKIASQTNAEILDPEPLISAEAILREREYWRRNRDLNYIGIGLLYVLNVIDANVDAHLAEFDISDDLSMNITPTIAPYDISSTNSANAYYGVSVSIRF